MTSTTRLLALGLAAAVLATLAPAVSWGKAAETTATDVGKAQSKKLRVESWHLRQNSGAELYQELCASCHGIDGAGNGSASSGLTVPAPALTHLKRAGIPRQHWAYVLSSHCDDRARGAEGTHETMPCWQRIFRQALGNEAAPLLVNKNLVNHLASIQH